MSSSLEGAGGLGANAGASDGSSINNNNGLTSASSAGEDGTTVKRISIADLDRTGSTSVRTLPRQLNVQQQQQVAAATTTTTAPAVTLPVKPSVLGSIVGQRSVSGTLYDLQATGSFESTIPSPLAGAGSSATAATEGRERLMTDPPLQDEQQQQQTSSSRERANTAPSPASPKGTLLKKMPTITTANGPAPSSPLPTVKERFSESEKTVVAGNLTSQAVEMPVTGPMPPPPPLTEPQRQAQQQQQQQTLVKTTSSDDDEEIKFAKAMALAIHNHPHLTMEEIRILLQNSGMQQQQQQLLPPARQHLNNNTGGGGGGGSSSSLLIPGRLTGYFEAAQQQMAGAVKNAQAVTAAATHTLQQAASSYQVVVQPPASPSLSIGSSSGGSGSGKPKVSTVVFGNSSINTSNTNSNSNSSTSKTQASENASYVNNNSSHSSKKSSSRGAFGGVFRERAKGRLTDILTGSTATGKNQQDWSTSSDDPPLGPFVGGGGGINSQRQDVNFGLSTATAGFVTASGGGSNSNTVSMAAALTNTTTTTTSTSGTTAASKLAMPFRAVVPTKTTPRSPPPVERGVVVTSVVGNPIEQQSSTSSTGSAAAAAAAPFFNSLINSVTAAATTAAAAVTAAPRQQPFANPTTGNMGGNSRNRKEVPPTRLTGIAWKRRGGMGKYSTTSAWEQRRIELQGTKLLYYRAMADADPDNSNNNTNNNNNASSISPTLSRDDASLASAAAVASDDEGVVVTKRTNWFEAAAANWVTAAGGDDTMAPRGYLDLAKEKATVNAAFGHSGAPSPFALSIKVRGETKWKLCFDYHKTQMEWLAALSDIVIQTSVDGYNAHLVEAADPTIASNPAEVFQQAPQQGGNNTPGVLATQTTSDCRFWVTQPYVIRSVLNPSPEDGPTDEEIDDEETIGDTTDITVAETTPQSGGETAQSQLQQQQQIEIVPVTEKDHEEARKLALEQCPKQWGIPQQNLLLASAMINMALALARSSSTTLTGFWYVAVFCNAVVFYGCLKQEPDWKALLSYVRALPHIGVSTSTGVGTEATVTTTMPRTAVPRTSVAVAHKDVAAVKDVKPLAVTSAGGYIPEAGCSTVRLQNETDPPTNSKNEMFAGWRPCPYGSLQVRSLTYNTTKEKIVSPGDLYEISRVDIFESPQRYPDMATRVKLPKVEFADGVAVKTWRSPDVLIISIALPTDPPKMGRSTSDGGGYTFTFYFTMHPETREILKRVTAEDYDPSTEKIDNPATSKVNAVRLLEEWCRRAPSDPKWFSRFKVVPNAHNLKEIGVPGWIAKYNGKPFLIKRPGTTGFIFQHPELSCLEFDISLHPFPYVAKQAICYLKEHYAKKVLVSFGFTIEGRAEDELPECVMGSVQLCYPDPSFAIMADSFFAGTSPRSF